MHTSSPSPSISPFRLGFDGGGTKTRAVVIDANFQILGAGENGASNPYAVGMPKAIDHIEEAANIALAAAGLSKADIAGWGLGLGGMRTTEDSANLEAALRERVGTEAKIVAAEDVVAAWSGAFGGETGAVPRALCIAGTGANCWGKNNRGEIAFADGAGPLLGDRGAGYWIGENALRHTARVLDGLASPDALAEAVLAYFGASDLNGLINVVYAPDFQRSHIAALVPVVLQHAEVEAAQNILAKAGRELALTALAVLKKLSDGEETQGEVALIGSVLAYAQPVKTAFLEALQGSAPQARLVDARFEPAVGAALLV